MKATGNPVSMDESTGNGSPNTDELDSGPGGLSRRSVLLGSVGLTGSVAATGLARSHPGAGDHGDHEHDRAVRTEQVGYHSLGGIGSESLSGDSEEPHYGAISELRVQGDLAFVSIFSSRDPTNDRGLAILDISEYTAARNRQQVEEAEMMVLSFLRNDNPASAMMDVKVSDDADYAFVSKQPLTQLFGEAGPTPSTTNSSASPSAAAVQAIDVSEPGNPQLVDSYDAWAVGPHNSEYHQIGGREYVFSMNGPNSATGGIYVLEFDRDAGSLDLVNYYTSGPTGNTFYYHDLVVEDDPRTGKPYGYLANMGDGARVIDVSDPTDITELGVFDMIRSHYVEPAPTLVDGKRVFIAGHEFGSDTDGFTGFCYLVDADPIDDHDGESVDLGSSSAFDEPASAGGELDKWVYATDEEFDNYTLSPHNFDITADGDVHLGHYHAGIRYLKIQPPGSGAADGWSLEETGFFRSHEEVPAEARAEPLTDAVASLSSAAPYFWTAVETNGVSFASCINTGVYAVTHDDIPVGTATPVDIEADREHTSSLYTASDTESIDLTVAADHPVIVRDRMPASWTVVAGDDYSVTEVGDRQLVEFEVPVEDDSRTYFVESPEESGSYRFGPLEYSPDGGTTWRRLNGVVTDSHVLGVQT